MKMLCELCGLMHLEDGEIPPPASPSAKRKKKKKEISPGWNFLESSDFFSSGFLEQLLRGCPVGSGWGRVTL